MLSKNTHKLLVTGSTGLVGSRFVDILKDKFSIITCGREHTDIYVDLLSEESIKRVIESSDCNTVVNFAAYTNVDGAESEKGDKKGEVYTLNSLLPLWLAQSCQDSGKTFYHISTDYVFDGKKDTSPYTEKDTPKPVNSWYAMTKYIGEENILNYDKNSHFAIVRISYPFSGLYKRKLDIARAVVEKLQNKEPYFGIEDQKIKPASVDDIAQALSFLIGKSATGIYHVAGNYSPQQYITPYRFAQSIAQVMALDLSLIKPISFVRLSKKRLAPRPQHTWLDTGKIEAFGLRITPINEALKRFMNQMGNK